MMHHVTLAELWIYPVKSLGGIALPEVKVMPKGFAFDRRWMLVDETNRFITQRQYPGLSQFKLTMEQHGFVIHFNQQSIALPLHAEGDGMRATVWNDEVLVKEVSRAHTEWFSDMLGMHCRLVHFPEQEERWVDPLYAPEGRQVSLADGYPVLLIGQTSLDDVNKRLSEPVRMNRFRPNMVVKGTHAFAEDAWRHFSIGQLRFAAVKPCARCVLTTINQETGKQGTEPLATLATYRKQQNKVLFGKNVLPLDEGMIKVGDTIAVE